MNDIIEINNDVFVEIKRKENRTIIILNRNGDRVVLADKRTSEGFSCDVVCDDNYVVVYSKGSMMNQIPLIVECAYSINSDAILNTKKNKKLAKDLEMMLISKRLFDIFTVVSVLDKSDLKSEYLDVETDYFIEYLTNGNNNISREEIISYILRSYPDLVDYLNLSVTDLCNKVGDSKLRCLSFYKMPQIIDTEEDKVQVFKGLVTRKREPYVTSEEMLQPTDPSKKNEVKNMAQEFRKNNLVRVRKRTQR